MSHSSLCVFYVPKKEDADITNNMYDNCIKRVRICSDFCFVRSEMQVYFFYFKKGRDIRINNIQTHTMSEV